MRKKYRYSFSISLLLLLGYTGISGQQTHPVPLKRCPVKTINFEQGLMNIAITGAITDAIGFTWFSTKTGLQRYNGSLLETITPVADGDTIAIHYPVFFLGGGDKDGKGEPSFLIGYKGGILAFNAGSNSFKKIITLPSGENLHYSLVPFKTSREGTWCLEEGKGITFYDRKGHVSTPFPAFQPETGDSILQSEDLFQNTKIITANDDFVFMRLSPHTVIRINIQTHQLKTLDYADETICGLHCTEDKLFIASKEDLSCIRISDGLLLHRFGYKQLINDPINVSTIDVIPNHHLLVVIEKHMYEFDSSCTSIKEITDLNSELFIKTGTSPFVYQDPFRRIWLPTLNAIKRIQHVEIPFEHLLYPKEKNNFVRSLYADEDKRRLVAGCYNGGIQLYDSSGKPLWEKSLITNEIKDVIGIEKLTPENYLIVTWHKGMFVLNAGTKQLREMALDKPSCEALHIHDNTYCSSLQRINASTILISTRANVYRCIFRQNQIKSASAILNDRQIYGYAVTTFLHTADQTTWVGTESGVILRLGANGALETINIPDNYFVRCMAEDAQHQVWVGTDKGLFVYSEEGKLLKKFTRETGLLNDFIYALLPDDSRTRFFASTNLGLSSISMDGSVKNYTKELGLQENEFNTQSSVRGATGKLFFGGVNGITAFYPAALIGSKDSPFIHITRLVVNDSLWNTFGGAWSGDTLQLAYHQNHLQFDIAAIGLLNPNEYLYRYRLHGVEKTWQVTHQPSGIRYTLEPGHYLLEIECSPILSSSSVFRREFEVIIEPPWWQTWWFISLSLVLLVSLVSYVVWAYNKRKYQEQIMALTLHSEIQNERERISKELHDNIGTQLSYISSNMDWIIDAPVTFTREEEKNRLSAVNRTAKDMISDLRETIWAMKKESVLLDDLADKLKSFIQSQLLLTPAMEIRIVEDIRNNIRFSPTEALNIYRICQEAIFNCVKHSGATVLSFAVRSGGGGLLPVGSGGNVQPGTGGMGTGTFSIVIADNGKGFETDKEYKGHYGLENMRHRAIDLGVRWSVVSGKGKGTTITIEK